MFSKQFPSRNFGLILLSAAVLSFEITLTRLFAIQQFHHFAFVVVSLAVLGFAVSGIPLSAQTNQPSLAFLSSAFSLSIATAYLVLNYLPFDSYTVAWDPTQIGILFLYFLAAAAPFFFAGWAIGLCLKHAGTLAHKPYAFNFVGAALGCLSAIVGISIFGTEGNGVFSMSLGFLAAAVFAEKSIQQLMLVGISIFTTTIAFKLPASFNLTLSPYKPLSITKLAPDAHLTIRRENVSGRLDVIETNSVHVFPGLSLNAKGSPPEQAALFIDGDGPIPATNLSATDPYAFELAAHMPSSLAMDLRPRADVLVVDPGGGLESLIALTSGASTITLASDRPMILDVLEDDYAAFTEGLLSQPGMIRSSRSSRAILASPEEQYDVILFALTDSFRPISSGAFSLGENFLITVEALTAAFDHLTSDGLLVITRWLGTPPSESARAWATLISTLESADISPISDHLLAYRGMRTATMIASPQAFDEADIRRTRAFLASNAYDPIHLPDLEKAELNQFNRLPEDSYFSLYRDLLADLNGTVTTYPFNIQPPTDDRPFFYHFFRWQQTPDVIAELGIRWQPFGGSGYLVLLALFGLSLLLALPVGVLPMLLLKKGRAFRLPAPKTLLFFIAIGAGYLMIEIPLIQKLTLLFDRPTISFTVVLFCMLLSSGLGSLASTKLRLRKSLGILIIYLLLLNLGLSTFIRLSLSLSLFSRIVLTVAALFPAGFLMGVPFVSGLRALETRAAHQIPWAWAVNGAASTVAGVLVAMFALEFGLAASLLLGTVVYFGAMLTSNFNPRSKPT
jgi:hypothetical protein